MLGFIGAGNLATFVSTGLCREPNPWGKLMVTDIDMRKAESLAAKFPKHISLAKSNQELVDACELVLLAIRPQDAAEILTKIKFRPNQTILSVIALKTLAELKEWVAPCQNIVRMLPLPPSQDHLGSVPYYPANAVVENLLPHLGKGLLLNSEDDLNIITAITGFIAPFYTLMDTIAEWAVGHGVKPEVAQSYSVSMFQSLATMADKPGINLKEMIHEAATPGGLNEYANATLLANNSFKPFSQVLEDLLQRVNKKP